MEIWLENHIEFLLNNVWLVVVATFVFILPVIGGGIYLFMLGSRTIAGGQFPPSGYLVLRDTPVVEGPDARTRGRIIQFILILLLLATVSIPLIIGYIFYSLSLMLNPG